MFKTKTMGWNYRVLAHKHIGTVYFKIHEVYYNGEPDGYSEDGATIGAENLDDIRWKLDRMIEALAKPILMAGREFPNEYKEV